MGGSNTIKPAAQASIQVTPAALSFGSTSVGKRIPQAVSITNPGTSVVNISQASLTSDFTLSGIAFPAALQPNQTMNFTVWFNGTTLGKAAGTMTFASDSTITAVPVALSGTTTVTQPQLVAAPGRVDFGSVTVGATPSSPVTLSNTGGATVTVSMISATGTAFAISGVQTPLTLAPGQTAALNVIYSPKAAGSDSGSLALTSNDPLNPTMILPLTGAGTTAAVGQLQFNPANLAFGNIVTGGNAILPASLTNSGQAAVHISQISVADSHMTVTGLVLPATLNPGQSAVLQVKYAPTSGVTTNSTLSAVSDIPTSPTTLSLSGTGVQPGITVSPASLSFGNIVNGTSKSQPVTITNSGTSALNVTQATLVGSGFSVTGLATPLTIAAGQTSTFQIAFAPQTTGAVNGSLTLASNAATASITMTGTGTTQTNSLTATPSNLTFGGVNTGGTATQVVTLSNSGNSSVTISQLNLGTAGFSATGVTLPATLTPGATLPMNVQFKPTASGAVSGNISLVSSQGVATTVSLSGTGLQSTLSMSSSNVAFGNVTKGIANTQPVQLSNTGNTALTISSATVTGSGFSTTGLNLPLTIAAGQTSSFDIQFAPQAASSVSGNLLLNSNAANSPSTITLSGTGIATTLTLSLNPASLTFGSVTTGSTSSQSVAITNTGNSNVAISKVTASGAGFLAGGAGAPVTLSPSQSITVNVQFSPAAVGGASGSVSVSSNATSGSTIALSGTGVAPQVHSVALSWNPDSTVTGFNVYRSAASGTGYAKMNASVIAGASYSDGSVQNTLTYYYVTTAVDSTGAESAYSNEVSVNIP